MKFTHLLALLSVATATAQAAPPQPVSPSLARFFGAFATFSATGDIYQIDSADGRFRAFHHGTGEIFAKTAEALCQAAGFPFLRSQGAYLYQIDGYRAVVCGKDASTPLITPVADSLFPEQRDGRQEIRYQPRLPDLYREPIYVGTPTMVNMFGNELASDMKEAFAAFCPQKSFSSTVGYIEAQALSASQGTVNGTVGPKVGRIDSLLPEQPISSVSCSDASHPIAGSRDTIGVEAASIWRNPTLAVSSSRGAVRFTSRTRGMPYLCSMSGGFYMGALLDLTKAPTFTESFPHEIFAGPTKGSVVAARTRPWAEVQTPPHLRAFDEIFCFTSLPDGRNTGSAFYGSVTMKDWKEENGAGTGTLEFEDPRFFGYSVGNETTPTGDILCQVLATLGVRETRPDFGLTGGIVTSQSLSYAEAAPGTVGIRGSAREYGEKVLLREVGKALTCGVKVVGSRDAAKKAGAPVVLENRVR